MTDAYFPAGKSTITVVDDDPGLVTRVRVMLEEKEFNLRYAYSGSQLLADLEQQKPDLIILDIMMRQMAVHEVLARLKENPSSASIPIILLTEHEDILGAYKIAADEYIMKPFTRTQLMKSVNRFLSGDRGTSVLPDSISPGSFR
jgi:DNA-binding response OmpR family regulator